MPEFKDSVPARQAEELVTTVDFNSQNQSRRRRRHPIGRENMGKRTHASVHVGPWDGVISRDMVQERMDRMAAANKSEESGGEQKNSKCYSTEVIGKPSPYKNDGPANQRGRSGHACKCHGTHSPDGNCGARKGIFRKMLGAIWPFKRADKGNEAGGEEKSMRQRGCGGRHFRPRNRSTQQRSQPPNAR
jgi:hypothetical protein